MVIRKRGRRGPVSAAFREALVALAPLAILVLLLTMPASLPPLAAPPPAKQAPEAEAPLGGCTIVRCLFPEGRFVVSYREKLHVLREGDQVPGTRLVVARITRRQAVLREPEGDHPQNPASPAREVLITEKPGGGGWDVTAVSSGPQKAA